MTASISSIIILQALPALRLEYGKEDRHAVASLCDCLPSRLFAVQEMQSGTSARSRNWTWGTLQIAAQDRRYAIFPLLGHTAAMLSIAHTTVIKYDHGSLNGLSVEYSVCRRLSRDSAYSLPRVAGLISYGKSAKGAPRSKHFSSTRCREMHQKRRLAVQPQRHYCTI